MKEEGWDLLQSILGRSLAIESARLASGHISDFDSYPLGQMKQAS